jgi:hypothetical protein
VFSLFTDNERQDDFPHPNDPTLASTFPHHKHVPPDIKRNRIPAPEISFTRPNLRVLVQEAEELAKAPLASEES